MFLAVLSLLWSCEKEFVPALSEDPVQLVVEGYIEGGEQPAPPYVILTRSRPFFSELSTEELQGLFVHDAQISVTDGQQTVRLTELCLDQLTPEQRALAQELFGIDVEGLGFNFCVYTDLTFSMRGETGKTYRLTVEADGQVLEAVTTIPQHVPPDSLWFRSPAGLPSDTLAELRVRITDPDTLQSFYRYFTKINDGPFASPFSSVIDDRLFDGRSLEFQLLKAENRNADLDPETFGLYVRGDTVSIKWMNIDEAHFNFWNTLEFNAANQGPFSSYTRIESNIEGGLGVWGGLSATYYSLPVPEN